MPAESSVQSVDRTLLIIETLASAPHGLSLSDIAAETGLHISTAHRLIAVLVRHGYAFKDSGSGKYRLSLRLFELGSRVSAVFELLAQARPMLDELASATKEAVHLVERDGGDVIYVYKAEPYQQLVRMGSCVGLRNPMHCTGVGKSILALLPEAEVRKIWDSAEIKAYTPNSICNYTELLRELEFIRTQGYALDREEHELGVSCIAAPIKNWQGVPVAAVSVSAPTARLGEADIERIRPQLLSLCETLSKMLGSRSL